MAKTIKPTKLKLQKKVTKTPLKRKPKPSHRVLDTSKKEQILADQIYDAHSIDTIDAIMDDPDKLNRFVKSVQHEHKEDFIIRMMNKRRDNCSKRLSKKQKIKKTAASHIIEQRAVDNVLEVNKDGLINVATNNFLFSYRNINQQASPANATSLIVGTLTPTDLAEIVWSYQGNGFGASIYSHLFGRKNTYLDGWQNYWQSSPQIYWAYEVNSGSSCATDNQYLGSSLIFEFTLPAQPFDSTVYYEGTTITRAERHWEIRSVDVDYNNRRGPAAYYYIDLRTIVNENPMGGDWNSVNRAHFTELGNIIYKYPGVEKQKYSYNFIKRGIFVKAGVEAKIYIGISALLIVTEGFIKTYRYPGGLDTFEILNGHITYFRVPVNR